jgi:hypothetical protein
MQIKILYGIVNMKKILFKEKFWALQEEVESGGLPGYSS